ncbi:MAG: tyrosine-type recombinase/integrase [Betaproteobacteria bacterium]|nr:tyrosine-type recombinase/integrase [Betaproteobacteria bacterium]MCL2885918.1 tyrosine-type recombinase/integrase [Betaproteobacteria bacterium]
MTLTIKAVEAAKPRERGYKLADGRGLYLYVTPAGGKSWRANFMRGGKQQTRTYGRYPAMSLAQARKAHAMAHDEPAADRQVVPTFESVMRQWLKIKLPGLSNPKHQKQVVNTLERFVLPAIGAMPINTVPRTKLVEVVQAVQAGGQVETAHRVAGRITMVFDYAQDIGLIEYHGAARLMRVLLSRKVRRPMVSIPPTEAGALMRAIDDYDEPVTRLGLRLMAYTFVRTSELRGMRWDELREEGAVWVIPESRMKLRLPHVVPLSSQARQAIKELRLLTGKREFVLDSPLRSGHPLSENTFLFALYRLGYRGRMTGHGFRSLASTVLNEQSGFASDVIERQLAHQETDEVRGAYNRAQYLAQRRELMQWWGDWLEQATSTSCPLDEGAH